MRSKAALLYGERATRFENYCKDADWTDGEFFYNDKGWPSTIGHQLITMQNWGLSLGGKIGNWFKQGLTYNVETNTISWEGDLGEDL